MLLKSSTYPEHTSSWSVSPGAWISLYLPVSPPSCGERARLVNRLGYASGFPPASTHGVEVDFVLGNAEVALEIKGSGHIGSRDLRALSVFADEFKPKHTLLVCNETAERLVGKVRVVPWKNFLERLWGGGYLA